MDREPRDNRKFMAHRVAHLNCDISSQHPLMRLMAVTRILEHKIRQLIDDESPKKAYIYRLLLSR